MARPWPALPDVGSTIVPPGLSRPARSAASIIRRPIRSLTLPPGYSISSFARTVGRRPREILFRRTRGVSPTASRNESRTSNAPFLQGETRKRSLAVLSLPAVGAAYRPTNPAPPTALENVDADRFIGGRP